MEPNLEISFHHDIDRLKPGDGEMFHGGGNTRSLWAYLQLRFLARLRPLRRRSVRFD